MTPSTAEQRRLDDADAHGVPWRRWGPYLSERAWGTVREDYSADGDAWAYLPFEQAGSRAFRWSEDGMAGVCDDRQLVCLALAMWNGVDPVLKERPYGLTNSQGNHGEDVKDYWWYLDATPTSSFLRWRYHYPQAPFPYDDLRGTNAGRNRLQPEYELVDTGVFDANRYWAVTVTWAKAGPEDLCWQIEVRNAGPDTATLEVLPTVWFRNRWAWSPGRARPTLAVASAPGEASPTSTGAVAVRAEVAELGGWYLVGTGEPLFCDNDTNLTKLYGVAGPAYPKDGIAEHVIHGATTVNPARTGTKASLRRRLTVAPGATASLRLRWSRRRDADLEGDFDAVLGARRSEADEFYAAIVPDDATEDEARVVRQASAGMLWSKQFYNYDIRRWLDGDPGLPAPPPERREGRNSAWPHVDCQDVISMPDCWEYPWFAAWDLAFHCVALAHLDPAFAKRQLILLGREWYQHPNGQLPAYEWNFGDVNPPVQAWAALRVAEIDAAKRKERGEDGALDREFLERVFHKLVLNFTWWVNRKDAAGENVFEGGFLGLDNIGLFDRSRPLPVAGRLEQSDGTAWMAMFSLNLLEIALILAHDDHVYEDLATKFFEHFVYIAAAMSSQSLWDEEDGFFYDVLALDDGTRTPLRVVSVAGLVVLFAAAVLEDDDLTELPDFSRRLSWFVRHKPDAAAHCVDLMEPGHAGRRLLSVVDAERLQRILQRVLDPGQLLSDHGVRSLTAQLRDKPYSMDLGGETASIDYEPAESTNYLFGGNSNWRGPVWFPVNYLLIEALDRYGRYFADHLVVEDPAGSGRSVTLHEVADDLARRLVSIFLSGPDGRRPVFGGTARLQEDPAWRDQLWFNEYFHGDNGAGLGASHQTGWTGLVLDLIADRRLGGRR
ncbi:MAG: MGH1-like glycoside hydrolase domain-containing protein [Acidimicrobiales bacterium]